MKMSDVFDLPVFVDSDSDSDNDIDIGDNSFLFFSSNTPNSKSDMVCHAINSHDQLTEELELLKAKYAAVCDELEQATVELDELRSV